MSATSQSTAHDPTRIFRLDGRVAIVTGASSGLGAHFARVLHGAGARVVMAARRLERLEELAAELPGSLAVAADLGRAEDREELVVRTVAEIGAPDVLVNNAGIVIAAGGGAVVNISSIAGWEMTAEHGAAYSAAKAGVMALTRVAAAENGRHGIRVNAVAPGLIYNDFLTRIYPPEFFSGYVENRSVVGRVGVPEDVAALVSFLVGPESGYITGEVYGINSSTPTAAGRSRRWRSLARRSTGSLRSTIASMPSSPSTRR